MSDDRPNEPVQSDFDDWLAEEAAPVSDPAADADAIDDAVHDLSAGAPVVPPDSDADPDADPDTGSTPDVVVPESAPPPDPDLDIAATDDDEIFRPTDEPAVEHVIGTVDEDITGEVPIVDDDPTGDVEVVTPPTLDDTDAVTEMPVIEMAPDQPVVEFEPFDGADGPPTVEDSVPEVEPVTDDLPVDTLDELDAVFAQFEPDEPSTTIVDEPEADPITFGTADDGDVVVPLTVPEVPEDPPFDFEAGTSVDAETGDADVARLDPFEDTGEAVFVTGETPAVGSVTAGAVSGTSFADLWGVEEFGTADDPTPVPQEAVTDDDPFALDEVGMTHGATREHAGLAEAIAAAETEDTEQVALSAAIPGLEPSVVGFDDVVEAEGFRKVRARASGDLAARVVTGAVLIAALVASLFWRPALLMLAAAVFVLGAGEFYTALVRHDRKPIALFGFLGIVGACAGAFWWSAAAIPISFLGASVMLLLFYAVTPGKPDPMGNLALTTTVMVWAGLGSFAMLIARSDDYRVLIAGVVIVVAATDIAAFFVGRSIGRTKFAPWVSPNKTVEGLVAGVIVAFGLGAVLHFFPPFELTSGLAVGAAAALLTPVGDLAMSAAKRSLGLKDMGSVLPGHGGFLDRIDGLLFVIPAAWAIFVWAGLL